MASQATSRSQDRIRHSRQARVMRPTPEVKASSALPQAEGEQHVRADPGIRATSRSAIVVATRRTRWRPRADSAPALVGAGPQHPMGRASSIEPSRIKAPCRDLGVAAPAPVPPQAPLLALPRLPHPSLSPGRDR